MIVVMGTFHIATESIAELLPLAHTMVAATRSEDGCIAYSFAQDLIDPGVIHVCEKWRDRAALDAHFGTDHMQAWRTGLSTLDLSNRDIRIFTCDDGVAV